MATPRYVSMEKKAAGKSSLFKFVSLRSPYTISRSQSDIMFVSHPNLNLSVFSVLGDMNFRRDYSRLQSISLGVAALNEEELKAQTEKLFDFPTG